MTNHATGVCSKHCWRAMVNAERTLWWSSHACWLPVEQKKIKGEQSALSECSIIRKQQQGKPHSWLKQDRAELVSNSQCTSTWQAQLSPSPTQYYTNNNITSKIFSTVCGCAFPVLASQYLGWYRVHTVCTCFYSASLTLMLTSPVGTYTFKSTLKKSAT